MSTMAYAFIMGTFLALLQAPERSADFLQNVWLSGLAR